MNSPRPVTATVTLTFSDVYWFTVRTLAKQARYLLMVAFVLWIISLVLNDLLPALGAATPEWIQAPNAFTPMLWFFPLLSAGILLAPTLDAKKLVKSAPNKAGITYTLSEPGVGLKSIQADNTVYWSTFKRAVESPDAFFLFLTKYSALVIPKRFFSNPDDIAAVRQLIQTHIAKHKLLAPTAASAP